MRGSDAKHVTPGTEGRNRGALVQAWRDRTRSGAAGATQGWSDGKLGIAFDGNGTGELIVCATVRTDGDGMPDPPAVVVRAPAITAQVARSPTRVTSPEAQERPPNSRPGGQEGDQRRNGSSARRQAYTRGVAAGGRQHAAPGFNKR
jgi:hypothetical protein